MNSLEYLEFAAYDSDIFSLSQLRTNLDVNFNSKIITLRVHTLWQKQDLIVAAKVGIDTYCPIKSHSQGPGDP